MNLSQLYYFRKLAEVEHYGKASEELYITQPSLSNSISNLEKELGVRLFERVGRNVRLTSYGVEFNKHICLALDEVDKAVNLMASYGSGLSGQIRLGTVISVQRNFLPKLLNAFLQEVSSNVAFDIHQDTTYGCLNGCMDGKFDLAFCGRPKQEKDFVSIPMVKQNLVVGVDCSHKLAKYKSLTLEDLKGYYLVSYRRTSYLHAALEGVFSSAGLTAHEAFSDEISGASLVTAEKDVVAVMLETLDEHMIEGVTYIPIEGLPDPFYTVCLVYKEHSFHSCATERLIEFATNSVSRFGNLTEKR